MDDTLFKHKSEIIINECDIDNVFESLYTTIISDIERP